MVVLGISHCPPVEPWGCTIVHDHLNVVMKALLSEHVEEELCSGLFICSLPARSCVFRLLISQRRAESSQEHYSQELLEGDCNLSTTQLCVCSQSVYTITIRIDSGPRTDVQI